jgi:excisionase family DNA binding protein
LRIPRRMPGASAVQRPKFLEGSPGASKLLEKRLALPVREVAGLLGISTAAVRLMIAKGELPGRKIGGGITRMTYIVPTAALLSWLEGSGGALAEGAA